MNTHLLHNALRQFRMSFLAFFSALTEHDYQTLLEAEREMLLDLLQERYGYTRGEAKAAWNEFVLRYVDGHDAEAGAGLARSGNTTVCLRSSRVSRQHCGCPEDTGESLPRRCIARRSVHIGRAEGATWSCRPVHTRTVEQQIVQ
jgi:hypothetical protein